MESSELESAVDRVAEYTAEMEMGDVDWERASAVNGLLAVNQFVDEARYWTDRAVETQTDSGQLAYGSGDLASYSEGSNVQSSRNSYNDGYFPTYNPAAMAWPALEFYNRTGEERYLDAVRRQYEYLQGVERTADNGISRREGKIELFTEIINFVCPFAVRYGQLVDEDEPIEEAVQQIRVHAKHLQDEHTGLFRHIWHENPDFYPASSYWGRGIGWATTGLIDTLELLPDDHSAYDDIAAILQAALSAVVDYQDQSGFWRQRLDDNRAPLEASGTLMFAYSLKRSVDEGLFEEESVLPAAEAAMEACLGIVNREGEVRRIARPPASAFSPLGVTAYGQGWFLLAADQFL